MQQTTISRWIHTDRAGESKTNSRTAALHRHLDWLLTGSVRLPNGMLAAWIEPTGPAFAYPESTGYLLSLCAMLHRNTGEERYFEQGLGIARALVRFTADRPGCGKNGTIYLFDTAVCLAAIHQFLTRFADRLAPVDRAALAEAVARFGKTTAAYFAEKTASRPTAANPADHWSEGFHVHLIKAANLVVPALARLGYDFDARAVATELLTNAAAHDPVATQRNRPEVYLHAFCYAVEGMLGFPGWERAEEFVAAAADWLAERQRDDGFLPSHFPVGAKTRPAGDATAQAVRIWQCVDPSAYRTNIETALDALVAAADGAGGALYGPHLAHRNSWATIFLVQSLHWQLSRPEPGQLV